MKRKLASQSAFFGRRILISFALCISGVLLALAAFALIPGSKAQAQGQRQDGRPLTPEEARILADGIKPLISRSTEGLVQEYHPDGSVSMNLQGRFQNVTIAKKNADGTISQACVNNPEAAAAFLEIDAQLLGVTKRAPVSQNQPAP